MMPQCPGLDTGSDAGELDTHGGAGAQPHAALPDPAAAAHAAPDCSPLL